MDCRSMTENLQDQNKTVRCVYKYPLIFYLKSLTAATTKQ